MIRSFYQSIRQPVVLAFAISFSVAGGLFQHASGQHINGQQDSYVPAGWQTLAHRNHQRAVAIEQKVQHFRSQMQPVARQPMVQPAARQGVERQGVERQGVERQGVDTRPYRLAEPVLSARPIRPTEPQLSAAAVAAVAEPAMRRGSDARPFRPAKASQPFRPAEPAEIRRPVRIPEPLPVKAVASDSAQPVAAVEPVTTVEPVAIVEPVATGQTTTPAGVKQPSVSQPSVNEPSVSQPSVNEPSETLVPRAKFLANASEQTIVQDSQLPDAWTSPEGQQPTSTKPTVKLGQPTVASSTQHAPTTAPPDAWLAQATQPVAGGAVEEDIFAGIKPFQRNETLYQPVSRRTVEYTSKPALIQKTQKSVGNEKPANETPRLPPPSNYGSTANVATPGTAIADITTPKVTTPKVEESGPKKDAATESKVAEVASYKPNPPRRNKFFVEEPEVVQQPKPIPAETRVLSRGNVGNYTRQSRFFR